MDNPTPHDVIKRLGLDGSISPLVNLIRDNNSSSITEQVIELAMILAIRGVVIYSERSNLTTYEELKRLLSPRMWDL